MSPLLFAPASTNWLRRSISTSNALDVPRPCAPCREPCRSRVGSTRSRVQARDVRKPLTKDQAIEYFLGFDPAQAIAIGLSGRVPWLVPPSVDPRALSFDGVDGHDLVEEHLQGTLQLKQGAPRGADRARFGDFEIVMPPIAVPQGFKVRNKALGWRALRELRQFLREAFPTGASVATQLPSAEEQLLRQRDDLARAIERHVKAHPRGIRDLLEAGREMRAGLATSRAALLATVLAIRAQWRVEDLEERRLAYAEELATEAGGAVEFAPPLRAILAEVHSERRRGRPITTAAVVRAARAFELTPRDGALLVALERGNTAAFPEPYDRYFEEGMAGAATKAWSKIWYRR